MKHVQVYMHSDHILIGQGRAGQGRAGQTGAEQGKLQQGRAARLTQAKAYVEQ